MARDEDEPPPRRQRLQRPTLDAMGVGELREYIRELRDEIARVETDIGRKESHKTAADAFFRKPG